MGARRKTVCEGIDVMLPCEIGRRACGGKTGAIVVGEKRIRSDEEVVGRIRRMEGLLGPLSGLSCVCLVGKTPGLTHFQTSRVSRPEHAQHAPIRAGCGWEMRGFVLLFEGEMLNPAQRNFHGLRQSNLFLPLFDVDFPMFRGHDVCL
jgi:hypothetical protein